MEDLLTLPEWHAVCERYRYDITRFAVEALNMTEAAGQAVTHQQEILFKSIEIPGSRTSVASGHGCFGIDTPIMLHDGTIKAVQDIGLDDVLMGDDGSPRKVLELYRGQENLYRFTYNDGTSHVFNESHILCLVDWTNAEYCTLTVREFNKDDLAKRRYACYRYLDNFSKSQILTIKSVKPLGLGDYYGFELDGNHQFLGGDFTVLHNTGKSRSAGIVALWHLLFYPQSVMMFTAPQIGQLRTVVWKEINICLDRLRNGPIGWLADFVAVFSEKIYIKGYKDTWFVFAKTAPKHQPTNIAGQHGDYYMVWGDEACGIDDAVMEVAIGALTHANNRAVLTSQPAKGVGFFYDTQHKLSHKNGGKWVALKFNGEMSPLVSRDKLVEAFYQYGSRYHPGYLIRIRGEFPEMKGEFLLTRSEVGAMFAKGCVIADDAPYGHIITVDVGGAVGRDSSVITVAKVYDKLVKGRYERCVHLCQIPVCSNRADINVLRGKIHELLNDYEGATLVIDPIGSGAGLCQLLKSEGVFFMEVHWGSAVFDRTLKQYYANKRSHAYVTMAKAVESGRLSIDESIKSRYAIKTQLEEQLTRLPYSFDDKGRWQMLSKSDMQKQGISSPDIADTVAFLFMERVNYAPVDGTVVQQQDWAMLEGLAQQF